MATTKIIIRENKINAQGECVIFVLYTHNQKSTPFSTGKKIPPESWDKKSQKVKKSHRGFTELNKAIEAKEDEIQKIANLASSLNIEPTIDYVRAKVEKNRSDNKEAPTVDFLTFCRAFIEDMSIHRTSSTLSVYRTTVAHLEAFGRQKLKKGMRVNFDTIDLDFYQKFTEYLTTDLGFSNNTVGKYIKTIKTFLSEATDRGLNKRMDFRKSRFKVLQEDTDAIYFNEKEIEQLYNLDLSKNARLDRVRDLFVIGCWVGLRFSDLKQIQPGNFIQEGQSKILRIRTIKTDQEVFIPLHPTVVAILEKYEGNLPTVISNQKANDYIKEVCQLCGLDTLETVATYRGAQRIDQALPKHQLVSTHTARRSFATNLFLQGVPAYTIMQITGHRTEKAFLRYIKVSAKEHARLLGQHWQKMVQE